MRTYYTSAGNALYLCLMIKTLIESKEHFLPWLEDIKKQYKKQFRIIKWFVDGLGVRVLDIKESPSGDKVSFLFQKESDSSTSTMNVTLTKEALMYISRDVGIVCLFENEGKLLFKKDKQNGTRFPWINATENADYQMALCQYDFSSKKGIIIPSFGVFVPFIACRETNAFHGRPKVFDAKVFATPLCVDYKELTRGHIGIPRFWFPVVVKTRGAINKERYEGVPLCEVKKMKLNKLEQAIVSACYGA